MQKASDATPTAQNFRINDATTHDGVVQQVAQTGIIPSQVTTQLSAISRSRSPEVVRQGAELFNRLYDASSMRMAKLGALVQKAMKRYRRSVMHVVLTKRCLWGETRSYQ